MAGRTDPPPTRGRILVADDEPHIRRILLTFLEASGFEVETVSNGESALERLRGTTSFDLVLLDIMMPEATGLDVLEAARGLDHRKELPVLILTAKGQDADRDRAFAAGADAFLTKPFSPKKLLANIDEILSGR